MIFLVNVSVVVRHSVEETSKHRNVYIDNYFLIIQYGLNWNGKLILATVAICMPRFNGATQAPIYVIGAAF